MLYTTLQTIGTVLILILSTEHYGKTYQTNDDVKYAINMIIF